MVDEPFVYFPDFAKAYNIAAYCDMLNLGQFLDIHVLLRTTPVSPVTCNFKIWYVIVCL